jgi:hypothetical protein
MPVISLKAHFDGQTIQLDEPYELPKDAALLVTVLSTTDADSALDGWAGLAASGLVRAYSDNEPEYSSADDYLRP